MLASNVGEALGKRSWIGVPFAGGMAELPYLHARTIVANDLHRHVINMARVMAHPKLGPTLYRHIRRFVLHPDHVIVCQQRCEMREEHLAKTLDLYAGVDRDRIRAGEDAEPDLMWAKDYFTSAWFSRSHTAGSEDEFSSGMSLRWNANGGDSAVRVQSAIASIPGWRRVLRRVSFSTIDALQFIEKIGDEDGHGVYCDPPFPGPGDRYKFKVDEAFQIRLASAVGRFKNARVVMRFYDHPLIRGLYPDIDWRWQCSVGRTQANKASAEVLLINRASEIEGCMFPLEGM